MKKSVVVLALCFTFVASNVFANNAGVGIGTVLLKGKQGKVMELIATCLNGICGNGTFAITTGTLGYKEGAVIGMNTVDVYVAENMEPLANDIAKGDGEYLDTLAFLMKVDNKDSFKDKLHKNFGKIYTSKNVTSKEVVANINEINS